MKTLRLVSAFGAVTCATVFIAIAARSASTVRVGRVGADAPAISAGTSVQLAVTAQSLAVSFKTAKKYSLYGLSGISVAVGDVNGDGYPDIVVADNCTKAGCSSGSVSVLLGVGDGTFSYRESYSSGEYLAESVAIADVNGDGRLDLIVANNQECASCANGSVSVLLGNGDGTFQAPVNYSSGGSGASSVAIADLNGDTIPDLVVANQCPLGSECPNGVVGILLGNGDGTFQAPVTYGSGGEDALFVAIGNLNPDGYPDLVVANACLDDNCNMGEVSILLGNGNGTFQSPVNYSTGGASAFSVAIGDLNGDGYPDLVVANSESDSVSVLMGNGDGTFKSPTTYSSGGNFAMSVALADVNGDGYLDVAVVNQGECDTCNTGGVSVLLGNGDGTLQAPVSFSSGGYEAYGVASGDFNGDGKPDLVATNIYESTGPKSGSVGIVLNNLTVKTTIAVSSTPNPSAVNQEVMVTATVSSSTRVPDGSVVTFYSGTSEIGTGTTVDGVAGLTASFSKKGKYTIKASYAGDAYRMASSGKVKQVVNP